jgi:hypothetical protein
MGWACSWFWCLPTALAFPYFAFGLFALPFCWLPRGVGLSLFSCRSIGTAPVRGGTHFLCGRKESKQRKRLKPPTFRCPPLAHPRSGPRTIWSPALSALVTQHSITRFALRAPPLGITNHAANPRAEKDLTAHIYMRAWPRAKRVGLRWTEPATHEVRSGWMTTLSRTRVITFKPDPPVERVARDGWMTALSRTRAITFKPAPPVERVARSGWMTALSEVWSVRGNRSCADHSERTREVGTYRLAV